MQRNLTSLDRKIKTAKVLHSIAPPLIADHCKQNAIIFIRFLNQIQLSNHLLVKFDYAHKRQTCMRNVCDFVGGCVRFPENFEPKSEM